MSDWNCPACGCVDTKRATVVIADGRTQIKETCDGCGKFRRWAPQKDFVMPFGKHKGKTVAEIVRLDPGYAKWAARELDSGLIRERFAAAVGDA